MMRKNSTPVRKAKKSAALIVAEAKIEELFERLGKIEDRLFLLMCSAMGLLITGFATLALLYFGPHAAH